MQLLQVFDKGSTCGNFGSYYHCNTIKFRTLVAHYYSISKLFSITTDETKRKHGKKITMEMYELFFKDA